ncbi:cytochrome P450 94A1-like [Lycium ferocissimum]|uniref:cytochrome P450 94A1-like n=1 Tax=Lycium ferocissimum TaxID=112874 RepID=UPI002815DF28|nr:cytochrome P450 94A1-like [Lycium ferocissimum]
MAIESCCYLVFSLVGLFFLALFFIPSRKNQLYPKSHPLIGSLLEFIRNRDRLIQWTCEIFDKSSSSTYTLEAPLGRNIIITKDPSNVKHILKTRFDNYLKESTLKAALSDFFREGLFLVDGSEWKSKKQTLRHAFDPNAFHAYISVAEEELPGRLLPFLSNIAAQENATIDLQNTFKRLTFDLIFRIGFGFDPKYLLPSLPSTPLAYTFKTALILSIFRYITLPLIWKAKRFFNTESEKRLRIMVDEFHKFAGNIIVEKKERLAAITDFEDKDLLARVMTRAQGDQLDDAFLIDAFTNFVLAGQDTLCSALSWLFWQISTNPNVEQEIVREISEKDRLNDMVYTHACIYESMRLHPPIPLNTKEAAEDDVWPDGTKVKKGTTIIYHIYAMGRSQELWGSDWADFRPERWLEKRRSSTGTYVWNFIARDAFTYPVFQAGPRTCLGKEIAVMLIKMVVATILKRFRVIPAQDNFSPHYAIFIASRIRHGFPVRIIERH